MTYHYSVRELKIVTMIPLSLPLPIIKRDQLLWWGEKRYSQQKISLLWFVPQSISRQYYNMLHNTTLVTQWSLQTFKGQEKMSTFLILLHYTIPLDNQVNISPLLSYLDFYSVQRYSCTISTPSWPQLLFSSTTLTNSTFPDLILSTPCIVHYSAHSVPLPFCPSFLFLFCWFTVSVTVKPSPFKPTFLFPTYGIQSFPIIRDCFPS